MVHTCETQKVVSEGAKQPDVAAFMEECGQAYTGDFLPATELVDLLLGREGAWRASSLVDRRAGVAG